MAQPKTISLPDPQIPHGSSGIEVEYIKSRDTLRIWGYFDHFVGIEGTEIPFKTFCDRLGIDLKKQRE